MNDLAKIAAELRRVLPVEHWHLVDKLVDYAIDDIMGKFQFSLKELFNAQNRLST